jgi:quinate/shikimate dehydrogenase (NAD+)
VTELKLGLIGVGIGKSRAPELHRLAGELCGIAITYDLIEPPAGVPYAFDEALQACRERGYRGVNVTYPFKERAAAAVQAASDPVRRLGAVNTVRFDGGVQPRGFNTDYTGFRRAFASRFPGRGPGVVAIVGAGGVGRAIGFALVDLHAAEIRLFDQDPAKSASVATALQDQTETRVAICRNLEDASAGADGLVNATPLGMHQHPGTPIPKHLIRKQAWAFDAIYTPTDTRFLLDAVEAGLDVLYGYELFFYQGVDAFEIFTGVRVDEAHLRQALRLPHK